MKPSGDRWHTMEPCLALAEIHLKTGDYNAAMHYLEIADQLARIRREHGNESIYLAYTTGQSCTTADPFERLMNCFGGFLDHYNNYSNPQINAMVRSMLRTRRALPWRKRARRRRQCAARAGVRCFASGNGNRPRHLARRLGPRSRAGGRTRRAHRDGGPAPQRLHSQAQGIGPTNRFLLPINPGPTVR